MKVFEKFHLVFGLALIFHLCIASIPVAAGSPPLPHDRIGCQANGFDIDTVPGKPWPGYHYSPDKWSRTIVFIGYFDGGKPPAALNIEYALACLFVSQDEFEYQNYDQQICDAIRFLKRSGNFSESDFYQLEDYSYSRAAESTGLGPKILSVAYNCAFN